MYIGGAWGGQRHAVGTVHFVSHYFDQKFLLNNVYFVFSNDNSNKNYDEIFVQHHDE